MKKQKSQKIYIVSFVTKKTYRIHKKKKKINIKNLKKCRSERHNVFTEEIIKITLVQMMIKNASN